MNAGRDVATIKRELRSERKTALALRARIISHGGKARAPRLWKAYARHKARIAELVHELRLARRRQNAPLREKAYLQALALVGVMEQGGNNTGPVVDKIIRSNGGLVGEPWCGDFMAFVYRLAGSKAVTRSWAAVRLMLVAGVTKTSAPKRGDIVRFRFGHTGMFVRWLDDNSIETIEGNTGSSGAVSDSSTGGDGVYRKQRSTALVSDYLRVHR